MRHFPTLTDLLQDNKWIEEYVYFREDPGYVWCWGDDAHVVMIVPPGGQEVFLQWLCPICGTIITYIQTPEGFFEDTHPPKPISTPLPLYCRWCAAEIAQQKKEVLR